VKEKTINEQDITRDSSIAFRRDKRIYPNKICLEDTPRRCQSCIELQLPALGWKVADDFGHSLKIKWKKRHTEVEDILAEN